MKNLIIFLSGCVCGAVGTLIYLRKDIKQQLEAIENDSLDRNNNSDEDSDDKGSDELPFTVGKENSTDEIREPIAQNKVNTTKVKYDSLVRKTMHSDDIELNEDLESISTEEDKDEAFYEELKTHPQFEPIHDMGDYNDPMFDTETYVFYRGDNVFCTDEGTIVEHPALLVGTEWTKWIGEVKPNTALVRDNKRLKSIDIMVEDGLYSDEYGDYIKED